MISVSASGRPSCDVLLSPEPLASHHAKFLYRRSFRRTTNKKLFAAAVSGKPSYDTFSVAGVSDKPSYDTFFVAGVSDKPSYDTFFVAGVSDKLSYDALLAVGDSDSLSYDMLLSVGVCGSLSCDMLLSVGVFGSLSYDALFAAGVSGDKKSVVFLLPEFPANNKPNSLCRQNHRQTIMQYIMCCRSPRRAFKLCQP
jgi:hypothetical protein